MVLRQQARDSAAFGRRPLPASRLRRGIGFAVPAAAATAIVAVVVLSPPYARLVTARYQRDCLAADNADAEAMIAAQQRLIDALPTDEVLTMRLARSRLRLRPTGERILPVAAEPHTPPGVPAITPAARPAPPPQWLTRAGRRLARGNLRRGLMLLAAGSLVMGMLLSTPARQPAK